MMFVECDLKPLNKRHFKELMGSRILYDAEFGIKDALLLLPIVHDGWRRYNSTIDWVEETHAYDQKPRFEKVSVGLSPYVLGKPPLSVAAILLWLGLESLWPDLHEALYIYWSCS